MIANIVTGKPIMKFENILKDGNPYTGKKLKPKLCESKNKKLFTSNTKPQHVPVRLLDKERFCCDRATD